ncbi:MULTISPECIES: FitA-like ribbon-helix-helix domain-containing protein [unclassified Gordonia (in: high G+C Gram-positive bacteria)]|uniref:FitA-like ribbon-helix-helix domain-containing protein n=1 Tax=unclassified Gordonia (in: high G+C Gram-positive bacteria) TaxID=2657482 RepID=UPI0020000FEB|nr:MULTISPECIES: Arc family DNA-binding protein [unclassified Gordonia (in: high G+C Gram-positive bacteria)]UQE76779.1 Arc family DNA-binding protein [Gordonia sp. PP30]
MATLTIRGFDDDLHAKLRVRAAQHGRSMEAEVRAILEDDLTRSPKRSGLGSRIHARFAELGDFETSRATDAPRAADLE